MKKTVLIITSRSEKTVDWKEREQYVRSFCQAVSDKLTDVTVCYTTYRDLEYTIQNGRLSIYDCLNDLELSQVNFVHFKNWQYETGEAPVVANYLKQLGIPFLNSEVAVPIAPGKLAQMFVLGAASLPVPDTFFASKRRLIERFQNNDLPKGYSYPLILKDNDGSRGHDNHLIQDGKEAVKILTTSESEKEYVIQNCIPNDGDFRLLFIGLDKEPLVFHRRASGDSHLNNTSQGGTGKLIEFNDFPREYVHIARRAAEVLGRELGGVDILFDKNTGKPYLLEVNGTPALATGYAVHIKEQRFADYLSDHFESEEEE